ncbi:hypothetical protein [Micromonospora sp. Llam0]|uniref:hypothetical protein n=1 Tax=Micromonospora sp. Llam0 TaxID=2485143 RepID=UPI00131589AB|nr:hypothetical protein [Micromonospora sp. Llam0]
MVLVRWWRLRRTSGSGEDRNTMSAARRAASGRLLRRTSGSGEDRNAALHLSQRHR